MAQNPNLATAAEDVVAVFDEDFAQVFADAQVIDVSIEEPATFFDHPLETSVVRTDHIIIEPNIITLNFIFPPTVYRDIYQEAKQLRAAGESLFIQLKTDNYSNMLIKDIAHVEDAARYDVIAISITFREAQVFDSVVQELSVSNVQNAENQSTVDRGVQQAEEPNASLAAQAADTIRGFFQ